MDELPLVPYMFSPTGEKFYDSTAFANWLDTHKRSGSKSFLGSEDPVAEFVIALIDEYGDEIGPYMAHHQRWVCSAADTQAGQSLANDFHHIIKLGVNRGLQQTLPVRQIARLPYLFSVAPTGLYNKKLPDNQQAPQRQGFPPTHDFIEKAYDNLLDALEAVLVKRSYLLGERFTLADASI